jgi:hypothetical protein
MARASKSRKNPGFNQFFYRDRQAFFGLMRASRPAFNVWFFMYMSSEYRNGVFVCRVTQEYIEAQTGHGHNQVDDAKALLREHGWIFPIGEQGMHGSHGHWDTGVYQVKVGTAPSHRGHGSKSKKAGSVPPAQGYGRHPLNGGTIVDTYKSEPLVEGVQSGESILGGRGGVSPPSSPKAKPFSIAQQSRPDRDDAIVDAASPLQRASASDSPAVSMALPSKTENPKPTPTPWASPTPTGALPRNPGVGTRVISDLKSSGPSWTKPLPKPQNDAARLAVILYRYIQGRLSLNQTDITIPYQWLKLWSQDFEKMIADSQECGWEPADIEVTIWYSQMPKQQEYYKRAQGIWSNFRALHDRSSKVERLYRQHPCQHEDCVCLFSNAMQYTEHLELHHKAAPPPPELWDQIEEEAWQYAEDICALGIGINEANPEFDPFADSREDIIAWENSTRDPENPDWVPIKVREDWGQWDLSYEMPEPLPHQPCREIRPERETELPEPLKRLREKVEAYRKELAAGSV